MTVGREQAIDGEKVRRLRNLHWMYQVDLARETGIALDTISRIETGQRPYPRRSTIFALAKALDVRPNELLKPEHSGDELPLDPASAATDECKGGQGRRTG